MSASQAPFAPAIAWFRHAAPYIEMHRGKTWVIALDGASILSPHFVALAQDLILLHSFGVRVVLVHGARAQIDQFLAADLAAPTAVQANHPLRVTDTKTLHKIMQVVGKLRFEIEAKLTALSSLPRQAPLQVCSGNFVTARPLGVIAGVDYQHTGRVRKINAAAIRQLLDARQMLVLSPLGYSPSGEIFNISMLDLAGATASAIGADKLVFWCAEDIGTQALDSQGARQMLAENPQLATAAYIKAGIEALAQGVKRVHLVSQNQDGAILQEMYSRDGAGLLITEQPYQIMRAASLDDVGAIISLLQPLEQQGVLVYRSREQIELEIEHFAVLCRDQKVIGCIALYPFVEEQTAEIACVVSAPEYERQGCGQQLFDYALARAKSLGLASVFVLTTQTAHWFLERGFVAKGIDALPAKKQALYNLQRQSKVFFYALR